MVGAGKLAIYTSFKAYSVIQYIIASLQFRSKHVHVAAWRMNMYMYKDADAVVVSCVCVCVWSWPWIFSCKHKGKEVGLANRTGMHEPAFQIVMVLFPSHEK